jgi:hypothetical protein
MAKRPKIPDPEPWDDARRPPSERPRHESAVPSPDDEAETAEAIDAEAWGETVELSRRSGTVDGDYNGAPELEALEENVAWEGSDALDGMEGSASEQIRLEDEPSVEEDLADRVAERREMLSARLDEARALGLEVIVETALAATDPASGGAPVVLDDDVLRDRIRVLEAATDELERAAAGRR